MNVSARRARLEPLLAAARAIADGASERGRRARERLAQSSALSPEGLDFALKYCLESQPSEPELASLIGATQEAPAAHVLLSSTVFVAAHRAIAIALAAAPTVHVRSSRRAPEFSQLLLEGAPGSFQIEAVLTPEPGDHVWAYGSDQTLRSVARSLKAGVVLHAHGSGFGLGVISERPPAAELDRILRGLAEDIALFDQRGCLSPRLLLLSADPPFAIEVSRRLSEHMIECEARLPRGRLSPEEHAEISQYRALSSYLGALFPAGTGFVTSNDSEDIALPPIGRHLHVRHSADLLADVARLAPQVTCSAVWGPSPVQQAIARVMPGARSCAFGRMQRPPFDGPVDRRKSAIGSDSGH